MFDQIPLDFEKLGRRVWEQNYNDTHALRLGVTYEVHDQVMARIGYLYNTPAAPDEVVTPLVSLSHGFTLIGQALQNPNQTVTLDCNAPNNPVLTLTEVSTIAGTVQQYNAFIRQQAQRRNLAFFNPNRPLGALYRHDDGDRDPTNDLIPKFPDRDSDHS